MKRRLLDRLLLPARVDSVEPLTPRLRRITLAGPALAGLTWLPGQHVRLQVSAAPSGLDWLIGTLRAYTVEHYDGQNLQVVAVDHGDGPGATWSRTAQPGDELRLLKPQGDFTVRAASYHLFAGEETAQAGYLPMLRQLPEDTTVYGRFEVTGPEEEIAPAKGPAWDLGWIHLQGRSAATSATLVTAVRELDLPSEPGIAYLAGEAKTIQLIRRHLVEERNWPRRNVLTKPFWTPGRKGMD